MRVYIAVVLTIIGLLGAYMAWRGIGHMHH